MSEHYLTIIFTVGLVIYALSVRVLFHILIDAEKRRTQALSILGLWGLFTIGEIGFFRYILSFVLKLENVPSEFFMTLVVVMLVWNVLWLFMIAIAMLMKKKRKLTKIQKSILQDL